MFKVVVLCTFITGMLYSLEVFDQFLAVHDWVEPNFLYQIRSHFTSTVSMNNLTASNSILFVSDKAKVIFLQEDVSDPVLFLNNDLGSWITKRALFHPLKVSGSYSVFGIMNIDDIVGLNIKKNYVVEKDGKPILLKAKESYIDYQYIELQKVSDNRFEAIYMDRNKVGIKHAVYDIDIVSGIRIIKKAMFKDLLINTNHHSGYEIYSIEPSRIPVSLLSPERFHTLFDTLE